MKRVDYVGKPRRAASTELPRSHRRQKAGPQNEEQAICPFTLEPSSHCVTRRSSLRHRCSYTLEPCLG